mmetsp:Transcript_78613/g.179945  ORF Transcript_78613/g.179945 Transcript_78613/m.179945 type:complete len:150 (-) Transcript_78613:565-1014(-)
MSNSCLSCIGRPPALTSSIFESGASVMIASGKLYDHSRRTELGEDQRREVRRPKTSVPGRFHSKLPPIIASEADSATVHKKSTCMDYPNCNGHNIDTQIDSLSFTCEDHTMDRHTELANAIRAPAYSSRCDHSTRMVFADRHCRRTAQH